MNFIGAILLLVMWYIAGAIVKFAFIATIILWSEFKNKRNQRVKP